jgi:carboxyl-terminal processing protease
MAAAFLGGMSVRADDAPPAPPAQVDAPGKSEEELFHLMRLFADTFDQVDRNYVSPVDRRKLVQAAVRGMLSELDPYSSYISPEDLARFNQAVEQEFGGVGIEVGVHPQTRRIVIMTPLYGTPAYKANLRGGDQIVAINGKPTEGMTIDDASRVLKGKIGETVNISVLRDGAKAIETVTLTRALIQIPTVRGDTHSRDDQWEFMLDDARKIGYIKLTNFSRATARELHDAMEKLTTRGMKGLVLDLRDNPGGLLTSATEIADLFLDDGRIVSTKGRSSLERVWTARKSGTFGSFPMAVIVNRFSASASEIVAAALQDHGRAVVVGERTWGKGSVQNVIDLEGGASALKLTTSTYVRPNGKNIHRFPDAAETDEWGVIPNDNYKIEFSREELSKYREYRWQRDFITRTGPTQKVEFVDRQLARATEYIDEKLREIPAESKSEAKTEPDAKTEEKPAASAPSL